MWAEDRSKGDSPVSHHIFLCPRCGVLGKPELKEEIREGETMIEDKLTRDQRIRLECLNQANIAHAVRSGGPTVILETAGRFEKFIKDEAKT